MTTPTILTLDTMDDRRELWGLLHRLPPARRVAFLADCCGRVSGPAETRPVPAPSMRGMARDARRCGRADLRLTNSVYYDLLMLAATWNLDLGAAAVRLEGWVRRPSSCRA